MAKETKIPNNPMKAYLAGKKDGTKDNMRLVSHILLDKCGFTVGDANSSTNEPNTLAYVWQKLVELVAEINSGDLKRSEIEKTLEEESNVFYVG